VIIENNTVQVFARSISSSALFLRVIYAILPVKLKKKSLTCKGLISSFIRKILFPKKRRWQYIP